MNQHQESWKGSLRGRFQNIRQRCTNPNSNAYKNYGGRGIKCIWETYAAFERDMLPGYIEHVEEHGEKDTTIDRVDVDGNYCKENCRWATWSVQNNNRRFLNLITIDGETKTLEVWAREYGINPITVKSRYKVGMNWREALEKPPQLRGAAFIESLYEDAVRMIRTENYVSQRFIVAKLKTGWPQTRRLVSLLEERGIIGPARKNQLREVLPALNQPNENQV